MSGIKGNSCCHRGSSLKGSVSAAFSLNPLISCAIFVFISTMQVTSATETSVSYRGVNIAGGEFAPSKLPGKYDRDYTYPDSRSMAYFAAKGMNIIRVPVLWERLQHQLGSELDRREMARLDAVIDQATSKRLRVILDVHNYATYRGSVIGSADVSTNALGNLWRQIAERYKDEKAVIFGLMNEPNNLRTETWLEAANIAIAEIRATGAKNLILVPGNGWTSARSWDAADYGTPNAEVMLNVRDPANNFAYEVHQYFNADWTGTSADCQSKPRSDVGFRTLTPFTQWARKHRQRGFLGEIGVGAGSTCLDALDRVLSFMHENSDVWIGWTYWAGGIWWPKDYFTSIQPLDGRDRPQMAILEKYANPDPATR
jgi:endoglucanase